MADIISKQELPVTITKVKIGTKDLNKSIIDQLPFEMFIYHMRSDGFICYGLPVIGIGKAYYSEYEINRDIDYVIAGDIIGYISKSGLTDRRDLTWTLRGNKDYARCEEKSWIDLNNYNDNWMLILFHSEGKLKKGIIDTWTAEQLNLKLEQIFI
ncbi:hypothetical protein [Dysgonomonas capnocytophagoides]|uniref:hypothetical protein n=1 Tax=Dysgonomonas capnocytophagoides TaxID=45254 RepID=UPI003340C60D